MTGDTQKHHAKVLEHPTRQSSTGYKEISSASRQLCNSKEALATEENGSSRRQRGR